MDPDEEERLESDFCVEIAFLRNSGKIAYFKTFGDFDAVGKNQLDEVRIFFLKVFRGLGFVLVLVVRFVRGFCLFMIRGRRVSKFYGV